MTTPPLADVPVRSADDLTRRWLTVLDPLVFQGRTLWLTWLESDGRMLPLVIPVDDLPVVPDPVLVTGLREVHGSILEGQLGGNGHLALALCRPGEPVITGDDDEWAEALRSALDDGQIQGSWSLHLAAAGNVVPLVSAPSWAWHR